MPPVTLCRYGYACTRSDCYFTHPEGVRKNLRDVSGEECSFGRDCFRRVCRQMHPEGRMLDQMRPQVDFCSVFTLVQPEKLSWVSAAFKAAYPAPDDGKDRCDFVAAVPMALAFADWKKFRGLSIMGTPDGVPSTPERIRLFPRTQKGEYLLQDPANRLEMRWSPLPCRPWRTLERMANYDQHWEENQSNYVLCAGYEDRFRGKGVCIELAVTGVVQAVDGGDGINAGLRVASDVLGLPGAQDQRWSVFYVSRPDDTDDEGQVVTLRTIVDASKLPGFPRHFQQAPHSVAARAPLVGGQNADAAFAAPPVPPPAALAQTRPQSMLGGAAPLQQKQQGLAPGAAVAYASSTAPASTDSDVGGSILSFGSYTDETRGVGAQGPPRSALGAGGVAGGATFVGSSFGSAGAAQQAAVTPVPAPLVDVRAVPLPATGAAPVIAVDELGNLLEKLNMTKYRPKFNSKQVDYKMLKMMTEEVELSDIGLPLGPRIKLMQELGIERSNT